MTRFPKFGQMLDKYRQGCSAYNRAIRCWKDGNLPQYETSLNQSATHVVGALELALKIYLNNVCRDRLTEPDRATLRRATFADLMSLMRTYADPPLKKTTVDELFSYRSLRNPAEHDGSIPSSQELFDAIQGIRQVLLLYFPDSRAELPEINSQITPQGVLDDLKKNYLSMLRAQYEYMDLGGISPRVGGTVVKIRMESLFVPLQFTTDERLYDSFTDDLVASSDLSRGNVRRDDDNVGSMEYIGSHGTLSDIGGFGLWSLLQEPKVTILGEPGAGKSTVGKFIAYSIASSNTRFIGDPLSDYVPLVVKAADYGLALKERPRLSFHEYLCSEYLPTYALLFESSLRAGQCLIIIDGLDEVPEADLRRTTVGRIDSFVREFGANRFLVTSRIVGYRHNRLSNTFLHVTLCLFSEDQINLFLRHWYGATEYAATGETNEDECRRKADLLSSEIHRHSGVEKLAGNPLLLTIIALAHSHGKKLPNKRVDLYLIATETLLENWPFKQRGLDLDSGKLLQILQPIAYHIFASGRNHMIREYELLPLLEAQICEHYGRDQREAHGISRDMLRTIEEHTGFFLHRGFDESSQRIYGFQHLTFAEYLTARYLAEQWLEHEFDLVNYVRDPRWHEVLLLMAGHLSTWSPIMATRFTRAILGLDSPFESILHRDLLLAGEILGDNVRVERKLQDEIEDRLIDVALTTPHMKLWSTVIDCLADINDAIGLSTRAEERFTLVSGETQSALARKAIAQVLVLDYPVPALLPTILTGAISDPHICNLLHPYWDDVGLSQADPDDAGPDSTHVMAARLADGQIIVQGISADFASSESWKTAKVVTDTSRLLAGRETEHDPCIWIVPVDEILQTSIATPLSLICASPLSLAVVERAFAVRERLHRFCSLLVGLASNQAAESSTRMTILSLFPALYQRSMEAYPSLDEELGSAQVGWIDDFEAIAYSADDEAVRGEALRTISRIHSLYFGPSDDRRRSIFVRALSDPAVHVRSIAARLIPLSTTPEQFKLDPSYTLGCKALREMLTSESPGIRGNAARAIIRLDAVGQDEVGTILDFAFGDFARNGETDPWPQDLLHLYSQLPSQETLDLIALKLPVILERDSRWIGLPPGERMERELYEVPGAPIELVELILPHVDPANPRVCVQALSAWSHYADLGNPGPDLLALLYSPDAEIRKAAARAAFETRGLGSLNSSRLRRFVPLLSDPEWLVARLATFALFAAHNTPAEAEIADAISQVLALDPSNEFAFDALWQLLPPRAIM